MDLKHFFDGQQSRENSASAFLATLLEYDTGFRTSFFRKLRLEPPLDDAMSWTIRVEDTSAGAGSMDITLESDATFVLIENKVAASAKRKGQLLQYYEAAVRTRPNKRIVALYLSPTTPLGLDEVTAVEVAIETRSAQAAGRDIARGITWKDHVLSAIDEQPERGGWFAQSGIGAVQKAIDDAKTPLPPDLQREVVRNLMERARVSLSANQPGIRLRRWPDDDQDAILTAKTPVTMILSVHFRLRPEPPFQLVDVAVDRRVRLDVATSLNLSSKGPKTPALVGEWGKLNTARLVKVGGIGDFTLESRSTFVHREAFDGTEDELVDLLVARGGAALTFLSPYFALAPTP